MNVHLVAVMMPDNSIQFKCVTKAEGEVGELHEMVGLALMGKYIGATMDKQINGMMQKQVVAATAAMVPS